MGFNSNRNASSVTLRLVAPNYPFFHMTWRQKICAVLGSQRVENRIFGCHISRERMNSFGMIEDLRRDVRPNISRAFFRSPSRLERSSSTVELHIREDHWIWKDAYWWRSLVLYSYQPDVPTSSIKRRLHVSVWQINLNTLIFKLPVLGA